MVEDAIWGEPKEWSGELSFVSSVRRKKQRRTSSLLDSWRNILLATVLGMDTSQGGLYAEIWEDHFQKVPKILEENWDPLGNSNVDFTYLMFQ